MCASSVVCTSTTSSLTLIKYEPTVSSLEQARLEKVKVSACISSFCTPVPTSQKCGVPSLLAETRVSASVNWRCVTWPLRGKQHVTLSLKPFRCTNVCMPCLVACDRLLTHCPKATGPHVPFENYVGWSTLVYCSRVNAPLVTALQRCTDR